MTEKRINSELQFRLEDVLPKFPQSMKDKILHSVELLRKSERLALVYDPTDGFYLAFSGGKDSQCLYHIAKLADVKFRAHMSFTSVDPPEVIRFVNREYPDVERIAPKRSIYRAAVERGILPTMRVRWCCAEYKEGAGAGKVTLIGIRHEESSRRASRNEVEISSRKFSGDLDGLEQYRKDNSHTKRGRKPKGYKETTIVNADGERVLGCIRGQETLLISPIIDWTEKDVWMFLDTLGVNHCSLYDEGWTRIGCIGCPMSSPKQKMKENDRWPHVKRNWIKAIKAIRAGGGHPKEELHSTFRADGGRRFADGYVWWNIPEGLTPCANVGGKLRSGCPNEPTKSFGGFSGCSSSGRLTEEQENEIAENIYEWWVSGKAYKQWYADKFLQQTIDFGET